MLERCIRAMLLKKALDLTKSINEYRRNINDLSINKGITNPELTIRQKLDGEIIMLQKILSGVHSSVNS